MDHIKTMDDLPPEIIVQIMLHLPDSDLITCALYLNKQWKSVATCYKVWENRRYYVCDVEKENEVLQLATIIPQLNTIRLINSDDSFEALYDAGSLCVSCQVIEKSEMVKYLLSNCPNITLLYIPSFLMQRQDFTVLIGQMNNLKTLIPENDNKYPSLPLCLRPIADSAENLTEIDFSGQLYESSDMEYFIEKKGLQLKTLVIDWCDNELISAVPMIKNCKNLKSLEIHVNGKGKHQPSTILGTVRELSSLTDIHFMNVINIESIEMTCALVGASFVQLKSFHISCGLKIEDDVLLALCTNCPLLQEIKIQDSRYITGKGLELLNKCSNLQLLDLCGCIEIRELGTIQQCSKLNVLLLSDCWKLQEAAFQQILHLHELQTLAVDGCNIVGFPVAQLRIYLPQLEFLGVNMCTGLNILEIEQLKVTAPDITISVGDGFL